MKYFFIVGERSGDFHASGVIRKLLAADPEANVVAWGGDQMQKAGARLLSHYSDMSFMGFGEILANLNLLKAKLAQCKSDILMQNPDVLILVDFPGFNLEMARFARQRGLKVCYFISPKIWAWRQSRVRKIKAHVDQMLVIFPFEVDFYQKLGYRATYVGNPLVEAVSEAGLDHEMIYRLKSDRNIAWLPGSRPQEVKTAINVILKLADVYDDYHFLVAGVDNVDPKLYHPLEGFRNISLFLGKTYEILRSSEVAIITSGTATLEAALLDVPQIVVYRTSTTNYLLARLLVKTKFISLVNIIAQRPVVRELIQGDYNPIDLSAELESILNGDLIKKKISEGYSEIREILGDKSAATNAAAAIMELGRSQLVEL